MKVTEKMMYFHETLKYIPLKIAQTDKIVIYDDLNARVAMNYQE